MKNNIKRNAQCQCLCTTVSLLLVIITAGCQNLPPEGIVYTYYPSGILKTVKSYQSGVLSGISRQYNEKGILKNAVHYEQNKIYGMANTYHPDGSLWVKEVFDKGKLIRRFRYDAQGVLINSESFK